MDGEALSRAHDQIIDANLTIASLTRQLARLERKIETVLAYTEGLQGPFADADVVRDLLRI